MKESALQALTIHLMSTDRWLTAQELAAMMKCTPRSVRNYIRELNADSEPFVLSSKQGYKWNYTTSKTPSLSVNQRFNPSNPEYRALYILRKILFYESIDKSTIIDTLYISDSTLESDLNKARSIIKPFALHLSVHGEYLYLTGKEFDKRRFLLHCLLTTTGMSSPFFSYICHIYPDFPMDKLRNCLIRTMETHGLEINGFALNNILLFLGNLLERIQSGHILSAQDLPPVSVENYPDYQAAGDLAASIEMYCHVSLNDFERVYLALLLISKANVKFMDGKSPSSYLSPAMHTILSKTLYQIGQQFGITSSLMNEELITQIGLHLQRLSARSCTGLHKSTPMLDSIQNLYPFLYNIALLICDQISKEYPLDTSQDEIVYVTLHLGTYIYDEIPQQDKLVCTIVCPLYQNIKNKLSRMISLYFGDSLIINKVVGELNHEKISPDTQLIISVLPLPNMQNTVVVSPFLHREDKARIQDKINSLLAQAQSAEFCRLLARFMRSDAFELNHPFRNSAEAIHHICCRLQDMGYIDSDFEDKVGARENISPTSFDTHLALPHANNFYAQKSVIYVIINEKETDWGGKPVNAIFLLALSEQDKHEFYRLYNTLSRILCKQDCFQTLMKTSQFEDLIPLFMQMAQKD